MEQFKRAKVVMLSSNEVKGDFSKERIYPCLLKHSWMFDKEEKGKLIFADSNIRTPTQLQNLYIISDDEIKKGDYIYCTITNAIEIAKYNHDYLIRDWKKVIATTNTSLYIHQKETISLPERVFYLPQPSKQFIEKYIEEYNKGNIITDVLVEYEYLLDDRAVLPYWNLKVNTKDNTITIKKLKETYNKEELCQILEKYTSFLWSEVGIHYPISLGNDARDKFINNEL